MLRLMVILALLTPGQGPRPDCMLGRPGSGDLNHLRWQAHKAYVGSVLWAVCGGGLTAFAWLTWRQQRARRPTATTEVTSP